MFQLAVTLLQYAMYALCCHTSAVRNVRSVLSHFCSTQCTLRTVTLLQYAMYALCCHTSAVRNVRSVLSGPFFLCQRKICCNQCLWIFMSAPCISDN